MSITNSQYDRIMKKYEERQLQSRYELDERLAKISRLAPEFPKLTEKISSLSVAYGKQFLLGDDSALTRMKEELSLLKQQKEQLLSSIGFSLKDLEPSYTCTLCQDKGYMKNEKCSCFKQQIIDLLYEQSNLKDSLTENNFSKLSFSYYEGEDLQRFENAVKTCRNFIRHFNLDYHNLFFYGTVGTGKSFLSGCIAKELMDAGYSVLYFSAVNFFERLAQTSFHSTGKDELDNLFDDLYSCDLLIIDDLGTELTNNFSSSQFFSCLNERILRKKSFIISTNLSLQELRDRYSDRIFSRITSNFDLCKITGPDIRMYNKRLNNRK